MTKANNMKSLTTLNNEYNKLNTSFLKATAKMEKLSGNKNFYEAEIIATKLNNMQEKLSELSAQIENNEKN